MEREWRSESWRAMHPLPLRDRIKHDFRRSLLPFRKLVARIALPDPIRYLDLAARWKAWHTIDGDYCEFGVYTGRSFVRAYHAITRTSGGGGERFYAFDSFEGLPEPKEIDMVYPQFAKGGLAATQQEFVVNLKKHGVDLSTVEIVPGWYSDILCASLAAQIGLSKVAVALIDCDLYDSTVPVLQFLTDLLVDGSIIIFDDWNLFRGHPDLGPQRAFQEWKTKNPRLRFSLFPPVSDSFQRAFIVHKPLDGIDTRGME